MAHVETISDQIRELEKIIEFMAQSRFNATVSSNQRDKFTDSHMRFDVTIEHGGTAYETEYQCNPQYAEPTFANVFLALLSDAESIERYDNIDDFAGNMGLTKPSTAIKMWTRCQQTHEALASWGFKGNELSDFSNLLSDADLDSLEEAASNHQAELNPPAPEIKEGWSLITDLMDDLWTGEHGDELAGYTGDIGDAISELADSSVDVYTSDLNKWIGQPGNGKWMEEAKAQGLLENVKDFDKMIMSAQYTYYYQDLHDNIKDSVRYAMLSTLKDEGVYAISPETAELLEEIDCSDTNTTFESVAQEARDIIEEHNGVMRDRGDGDYETIPFVELEQYGSPPTVAWAKDEIAHNIAPDSKPGDFYFGFTNAEDIPDEIAQRYVDDVIADEREEAEHASDLGYDLDAALDKAEQTARNEQGNERDSAALQASKDAR